MILQALLEGGWSQEKPESEGPEEEKSDDHDDVTNSIVQAIMLGSNPNEEETEAVDVQSALDS